MRQTLFFIPDEIAGVPTFGVGWLLLLWIGLSVVLIFVATRKQGWNDETRGMLPFLAIVGMVIAFVLPRVVIAGHGLPIRGYGVFLLLATVCGVLLAAHRARQVGLASDVVFSLAFSMFVGGIVGARLFYVIQYWDEQIRASTLLQTLGNILNFVQGGLVVYGSLIGALIAACWFLRRRRLPLLAVGDLIAPSLALGLAIGRIGCLMNGCCYGGTCAYPWAVSFPPGSPPYYGQHASGELYGFRLGADDQGRPIVKSLRPDGAAAMVNLPRGAVIQRINDEPVNTLDAAKAALAMSGQVIWLRTDQGDFRWSVGELPARSLSVHPTQIYSSINAAILCLLTYSAFPFRGRDGEIFALLMGLYAATRFLLEKIRTDEPDLWNTGMSISQNVSVLMFAAAVGLTIHLLRRPRGSYWPQPRGAG